MATEPLLVSMIEQDREGLALGINLLLECRLAFAKSDAAAACLRLKRRKGSVVPEPPLAFTAFSRQCYAVSEGARC